MSTHYSQSAAALCLLASCLFTITPATAADADFDKPVFEFQSKMANKGNATAQYFLAQMYEQGRGTEANAELARHWYEQAKRNGYVNEGQPAVVN